MALCEINNVTKTYGEGAAQVHAVKDVTLTIEAGEFTAFVGPSGSGKTTLLNQVGCLDKPTSGSISIDGVGTSGLGDKALSQVRGDKIGFIFQSYNLIPVLTAAENVELALTLAKESGGRARAVELLNEVGLEGLADRRPNQLSGGQQQRVAVARALVKRPALVIADEPTANLDSASGTQILNLMRELNAKHGVTFLFSTHDPMVMEHARRIVVLRDGEVIEDRAGGEAISVSNVGVAAVKA
ncbi:MAG: ABC transporter ATP-binding protein [Deltaproteobacteria bacterium]|nr:ABC transporter ATP-binding protein [Deltaproteobacteria bacterium]